MDRNPVKTLAILLAGCLVMLAGCNLPATNTPAPGLPPLTPSATQTATVTSNPEMVVERTYVSPPGLIWFEMVDSSQGWGLNQETVLRTEDGGENWYLTSLTGITDLPYRGKAVILNSQTGWVLEPDLHDFATGFLHRTNDGGVTWHESTTPFGWGELSMIDELQGFALVSLDAGAGSSSIAIYSTNDGGASWQLVYQIEPNSPAQGGIPFSGIKNGIAFRDAHHGWVTGSIPMEGAPYLFRTDNGGLAWNMQEIPLPMGHETDFIEVSPPFFFSAIEGTMPARLYGAQLETIFYSTMDGGESWNSTTPVPNSGQFDFFNTNIGVIWDGITLHATHDGGLTWATYPATLDANQTVAWLSLTSESGCLALIYEADGSTRLYRSLNSGQNWSPMP